MHGTKFPQLRERLIGSIRDLGTKTFRYRGFQCIRLGSANIPSSVRVNVCFNILEISQREGARQDEIRPQSKAADQRWRIGFLSRRHTVRRTAYVAPISSACATTGCRSGRRFYVTGKSTALIGPRPLLPTPNQTTDYLRRAGTDLHSLAAQHRLSPVVGPPDSQIGDQEAIPTNRAARLEAGTSESTSSTPARAYHAKGKTVERPGHIPKTTGAGTVEAKHHKFRHESSRYRLGVRAASSHFSTVVDQKTTRLPEVVPRLLFHQPTVKRRPQVRRSGMRAALPFKPRK